MQFTINSCFTITGICILYVYLFVCGHINVTSSFTGIQLRIVLYLLASAFNAPWSWGIELLMSLDVVANWTLYLSLFLGSVLEEINPLLFQAWHTFWQNLDTKNLFFQIEFIDLTHQGHAHNFHYSLVRWSYRQLSGPSLGLLCPLLRCQNAKQHSSSTYLSYVE